jgi:saccharopine dehydrogenase-like NADP-dependent oxidoreductase
MKTIAYIMSTYHIGTHNLDIRDVLKSFIQDKDQAEEMITQYTCYYNAIKRWKSNHKKTEILHQLEISNLLEQLKNN